MRDYGMSSQGQAIFQQLELDFASALASALNEPEQADIALMCVSLDHYLEGRSHNEQLRVAGDAIMLEDQFRGGNDKPEQESVRSQF